MADRDAFGWRRNLSQCDLYGRRQTPPACATQGGATGFGTGPETIDTRRAGSAARTPATRAVDRQVKGGFARTGQAFQPPRLQRRLAICQERAFFVVAHDLVKLHIK